MVRNSLRNMDFDSATEQRSDAGIYWEKASECRIAAELANDPEVRDVWLQLANQWMHLLLHANRRDTEPTTQH